MTAPRLSAGFGRAARRGYRSRLRRPPSAVRLGAVPLASVLAGSATAALPFIVTAPMLPPFGFLMLVGWRLLRPGLWPLWSGFFFGLADDLFSGQPVGSGALLFTAALTGLEIIDRYVPDRDWKLDWAIGSALVAAYLFFGLLLVGLMQPMADVAILAPQLCFSILAFPIVIRIVAGLDRWRTRR